MSIKRSYGETSVNLNIACEAAKMVGKRDRVILVVDDDPTFLGILTKRLEACGRKCVAVQTLASARAYLEKCHELISAVVVDYYVGRECGMDFVTEVLKDRSLACFLVSADAALIHQLHTERPTIAAIPKRETRRIFESIGVGIGA
jgi:CheY-like chemotaxis protein